MSAGRSLDGAQAARLLRAGLLAIGALGLAGTTLQLALDRHWDSLEQLIPWVAIAGNFVALAIVLTRRPRRGGVALARALSVAVLAVAAVGIWRHVNANYEAGPLDFRYSARWDSMSALDRWWTAASQGVGPAPALAAGALAETALCVLLASFAPFEARDPGN